MVVVSISGIRGIVNQDLSLDEIYSYVDAFARQLISSKQVLVGRDTRPTGDMVRRTVCSAIIARGLDAVDYGMLSTPALFRESRLHEAPALMITASHNEPEWNGIKLIVNGRGISSSDLDQVLARRAASSSTKKKKGSSPDGHPALSSQGSVVSRRKIAYNRELIDAAGEKEGSGGVRVAVDLNGGAAISHAPQILEGIGCSVKVLGGSPGIFSRTIDPTNDDLKVLTETVRKDDLDIGFAFDCDGDRLVLVDDRGEKKTGDYMLALTLKKMLPSMENRCVVISVDTSLAVEDVVRQLGGTVYRSKVGEANVVSTMVEKNCTLGGEGSSGGLIDGSFNYCRDSMTAAVVLVKAIKKSGRKIFREVPVYKQARLKFPIDRKKALAAMKRLQKESPQADLMDGIKVTTSRRSWVLIRVSGTEDAIRVSAESTSAKDAQELADSYLKRIKKLA